MDRAMQLRHLEQAERHLAEGIRHIADQEQLIAKLDRGGQDTTAAQRLLENFHSTQALHTAQRHHILKELEQ
jgi:hypothetical protein